MYKNSDNACNSIIKCLRMTLYIAFTHYKVNNGVKYTIVVINTYDDYFGCITIIPEQIRGSYTCIVLEISDSIHFRIRSVATVCMARKF